MGSEICHQIILNIVEQVKKADCILAVPQFCVAARRHFLNLGSYDPAKRIIGKLSSQGPHKKCCHFNYKKKNHKNNHPERVHRATEEAETNFVTRTQVLLTLMYNCCNFYIDGLICCVAMVKLCCSFKVLK